jgi:hypothetical protein
VFTLGGRVDHAYSVRRTREAARITVLGAGLLVASLISAAAQDPHSEIFTGLEASNNAISGYLGAGYAFGKGLYERGWRVRAVGALGHYDYRGTLFGAGADLGTTFDGDASYGAALIGYQFRTQALFLKLFAGVEAEDQSITPRDPENSVQGSAVGLKLGKLARPFAAVVPLRRCVVRNRVSAILELGAGGLSPFATLLARA